MNTPQHLEELDLSIPDMDTDTAEARVAELLTDVPGVHNVRVMQRGAFVRYDPATIHHDQICALVRRGGFRASTYQDSESGETGSSSQ